MSRSLNQSEWPGWDVILRNAVTRDLFLSIEKIKADPSLGAQDDGRQDRAMILLERMFKAITKWTYKSSTSRFLSSSRIRFR